MMHRCPGSHPLLCTLGLALLLSACGAPEPSENPAAPPAGTQEPLEDPTAPRTPPATPGETPEENRTGSTATDPATTSGEAPAYWRTDALRVDRSDQQPALLQAVRTGRHEGYDRIVFAFGDGPVPGYHIAYARGPVQACGSGQEVSLDGAAALEIRMVPAHAHTEAGKPTVTERSRQPALPVLTALALTCDFEADVTWAAGLTGSNAFRAFELRDPARLVVDVRH